VGKALLNLGRQYFRAADGMIPEMNQYLLTFRDEEGKLSQCEARAPSMRLAIEGNQHPFQLVKIERIDPETGAVLGGRYYE
jgi:hypothetical protein